MGNCWPSLRSNLSPVSPSKPSPAVHHNEDVFGNNVKLEAGNGGSAAPESDAQKPPPSEETRARNAGGEASGVPDKEVPPSGQIVTPNLKMFSYAELKSATRNFRPDTLVGEGGFGRVFKGWVDTRTYAPCKVGAGIPVAVKKSNPDSSQGLKEWQAEVKFLGKFSHPNLVKLLGYCWEDRQFLLVYEYMQKGSLESHLFRKGAEPLSWETRLQIAVGAARGLEFLHSTEKKVIYRDFKASNILLDVDFTAKLSDFGLAKLGPADGDSHVTTRIVGTYGYAAPEYIATGHLYVRSDVYGFGVVLLEIITGQRVLDLNRPSGEHNLVEWARPFLPDKKKLKKIMDPALENQYPPKAAFQAAELILECLESDPKNRPSMAEVLGTLEQIREVKMNPKESRAAQRHHQPPRGDALPYGHARSPLHHKYGGSAPAAWRQPRSPLRRSH